MTRSNLRKAASHVVMVALSLAASIGISYAGDAVSYSQATLLTLKMSNATTTEVLTEIEKRSEFIFFYQDGIIDDSRPVSINVRNETVDKILDKLLASTSNTYTIDDRQVFIVRSPALSASNDVVSARATQQPQTRNVTGRILNAAGDPIIGAAVQVSGNAASFSVSDAQGNYRLTNVPADAVLIVTYLGYQTAEVNSGVSGTLDIIMTEDTQLIDEVVVVGYGTQRKETLTGAVASISSDQIMTTKTDNLINNVQGKVAGLFIRQRTGEPGAFDSSVSIRGFGEPIVVIDGVVRNRGDWDKSGSNELAQLNSEDIETFTVLKDGAAAIYGMNSANGVIIVTTKKGSSGAARVSYNGMFGIRRPTGMPDMVDAYTYRMMENEFQKNIGAAPKYDAETIQKYKDGIEGYTDHDWIDMYLRKSVPSSNHTVSVRGGTDKVGYYASLGYSKDNGLIKSDIGYYNRYSLNASFNAKLNDNLKMNFSLTGRADKSQRESEPFIWTYKSLIVNDRGVGPYTIGDPTKLSYVDPEGKNPAALIDPDLEGYERNENQTAYATMDLTYTAPFLPGLSVNVLGSYDHRQENGSILNRKHQLWDYYNSDTPRGSRGSVAYENRMQLYHKTYGKVQINYNRKFGDHSVAALAAGEASQERRDRLTGRRNYENDFYTFDILDQASPAGATNSGLREFRRAAAFLGRANYDYAGKYMAEVMVRYDGSFRYAPAKRWSLFPSASVGWRISEESFLKDNVEWLNNMKLRASWGESGRDQGNLYEYMPAYTQAGNHGYIFSSTVTPGFYPPGVTNTNMGWVRSRIINAGVDITVLRNLDVTLEWYERRLTGILANRIATAPNTFGASFPQENLNSERNLGLELDVKWRGSIGKDFKYTVGGNVSYTRFQYLHRERGKFNSQWNRWKQGNFNNNSNRYTGGTWLYDWSGRYGSLADYELAPLQNGGARGNSRMLPGQYKIVDANGDGRINSDDEQLLGWSYGDVNPPLQFGFNLDASYKSWDVSLLFQGAALYALNYRNNDIWGYGRYPTLHSKFLDRWHVAEGSDPLDPNSTWIEGKYPAGRPYNYDNTTDAYVTDVWRPNASYLRLKNIELGYTLPQTALKKIGFSSLRVYVNATNLLTFTRKELKEYDPERWENSWDAGLSYPIMKAVNFGINVSF